MKTKNATPKNLLVPFIVLLMGLASAFILAPMTAQRALEADYATCLNEWQNLQNTAQKEMFSWIEAADLLKEKADFEGIEKLMSSVQMQYTKNKNENSIARLGSIHEAIKQVQMRIFMFSMNNKEKLEAKKQVAKKLKELQEKNKQDVQLTESLEERIKASALPEKYKSILFDSIASAKTQTKALTPVIEAVASYYTPEYENKALMDFDAAKRFLAPNDKISIWLQGLSQTLTQTSKMLENFDKAEQIVPPTIAAYQNTLQGYQQELYSPTQPALLRPNAAMKKADSLLNICKGYLLISQEKAQKKEFVEAYITLEQLNPIAANLEKEFNHQKQSYQEFVAHYEAIQKDLQEIEKANLNSSQKAEMGTSHQEAFLAHQMALSYAMAGNWALARSRLQESESKSAKAYQIAYRNSAKTSNTSSYNNKKNNNNTYSSNRNSSGSSYKSSSGSSSSSNKSNSYSSSSRKSDSRSWGSSSSSSKKSSTSRSSSSSSRKSDSRSWGSRSGRR
jgi:hypothetical protein